MKKVIVALACVVLTTSCTTTAGGAMNGALFGGLIGSSIGGISSGPRGSDVGQLVGMVAGGVLGAAVGHAQEKSDASGSRPVYDYDGRQTDSGSQRSEDAIYDDRITMDKSDTSSSDFIADTVAAENVLPLQVSNVRFINDAGTEHIAKGELVKISFEIRNTTHLPVLNLVPVIEETTHNKYLAISPATMVESLSPGKAIRYTAYISAQRNLKKGTANFLIRVDSGKETVSNVVGFGVPLN